MSVLGFAVAFVPSNLRSGPALRRQALVRGFLGPSRLWRAVGVVVYGTAILRRVMVRQPEVLDVARLRAGEGITVSTSRRRRRRQSSTGGSAQ